jgi:hypothetical protein
MLKIDKPIKSFEVVTDQTPPVQATPATPAPWVRPDVMVGETHKIKPAGSDHAVYITVNRDEGRPREVFINSKDASHHVWVTALTRLISAILRREGDYKFLTTELKACFDPNGGYFVRGGTFMPSVVAHIGHTLERAFGGVEEPDPHVAAFIAGKRAELVAVEPTDYPASAALCPKCSTKALMRMDGCDTCLSCGYSKCG